MKYFCLVVLVLLTAAIPAHAQECCRVEGLVQAASGAPIAGADVVLAAADAKAPLLGKTGADGRYVFIGVKPGTWVEVRVMSGGRPVASSYTLVTSVVETLNIRAQPESTSVADATDLDPRGGASGEVRGLVRDTRGEPVAGALVSIAGTPISVTTDSAGRYSFGRVRAKLSLNLQVTATGHTALTEEVSVPEGGASDSDVALAIDTDAAIDTGVGVLDTVPDRPSVRATRDELAGVVSVSPYDVFRGAQFLPAASVGQATSELVVHGAAPDETQIAVDGFAWYSFPRLFGGLAAPLNTASVQDAEIVASPLDADGGGRLSGLVRLDTSRGPSGKISGTADVGVLGAGGTVGVPLGPNASLMMAARQSWPASIYNDVLDRFAGNDALDARDRSVRYSGGTLAASPDAGYGDVNGRFEIAPGQGNRASVSFYDARSADNFSHDVLVPAPATTIAIPATLDLPSDAAVQNGDVQSWTGRGVSAMWERRWSADLSTTAIVAQSQFSRDNDQAFLLTSPSTGLDYSLPAGRGGSSALSEHNDVRDTTIRVSAAITAGFRHAIEAGIERTEVDATYTSRIESGAAMTSFLTVANSGATSAIFVQDVWRPIAKLTVTPGLRVTHADLAGETDADPRATASYQVAPRVVLKGAWSIDHQSVTRIVREDREHGDGAFWAVSDGRLIPVARSQEGSAGLSFQEANILFDAHAYYRTLDGLTLFAPRLLPGVVPAVPSSDLYTGTGTSAGVEFLVQHRLDRNSIWASYAGGRTEYTYPSLETGAFPASFDRQHQFKLTDTMTIRGGWSVTGAFAAATGLPYTPSSNVQAVWFQSGALAYQPLFDGKNSARLPAFSQLDISSQIVHRFGALTTTAGATVFNVYDRHNVALNEYDAAGTTAVNGSTLFMRRAADVFFRIRF